jgi:hypothetical protein
VSKPWFVYLVRAANGSLYCGISDDPVRRFAKHQSGKGRASSCPARPWRWSTPKSVATKAKRCAGAPDQEAQEKRQGMPGGQRERRLINLTDRFPSGRSVGR